MLIEGNTISSPGAAVLMAADSTYWYESGATREVIIRDNRFERCATHPDEWGSAVITCKPEAPALEGAVHGRIEIHGNTFDCGTTKAAELAHVANVSIAGNSGAGPFLRRASCPSWSEGSGAAASAPAAEAGAARH